MIQGLRSVRYVVTDLEVAQQWYSQVLEVEPYLVTDSAVMYFLDGSLLELVVGALASQGRAISTRGVGQVVDSASPCQTETAVYWGVDDLRSELIRLSEVGIQPYGPLRIIDPRTMSASVLDPFGNVVGFMERNDPSVVRARSQRVAEKVALREVRKVLDDLAVESKQEKKTIYMVLALIAVGAVLAGVLLWHLISNRPPVQSAPDFIIKSPLQNRENPHRP